MQKSNIHYERRFEPNHAEAPHVLQPADDVNPISTMQISSTVEQYILNSVQKFPLQNVMLCQHKVRLFYSKVKQYFKCRTSWSTLSSHTWPSWPASSSSVQQTSCPDEERTFSIRTSGWIYRQLGLGNYNTVCIARLYKVCRLRQKLSSIIRIGYSPFCFLALSLSMRDAN